MDDSAYLSLILVSISFSLYLLFSLSKIIHKLWFKPVHIQNMLSLQGIKGPPYKFYHGNTKQILNMRKQIMNQPMEHLSHDIFPKMQPHYHSWIQIYGKNFLSWYGTRPQLIVTDPYLIKEVLNNKHGSFTKRKADGYIKKIFGDGLVTTHGEKWAKLRKIANHDNNIESLKRKVPTTIAAVEIMLERWKDKEGKEIEVWKEFELLTSEVISRTAFGSNYLEGKTIFEMLRTLSSMFSTNYSIIRFPGYRSKDEIESDKLDEEIRSSILKIIKRRKEKMRMGELDDNCSDYLGLLIKANHDTDKRGITVEEMIDECKTLYMSGHETTTSLLSWTCMLLAINTDWQEKARTEVIEQLNREQTSNIDVNFLARLKTMNMILNESLRLYPPVLNMLRRVDREAKLGDLILPASTEVIILTLAPHHDHEIWGEDVHLFKPERFSEGIMKATKNIPGFIPFSSGPRVCAGINFALNEAKIALATILQRYSFTLSPAYVHSPMQGLINYPQHGVQIIIQPL